MEITCCDSFSLSFPESPEIVQIFERLAKACFNMMDPNITIAYHLVFQADHLGNPNLLNTPLTLVYLMKQLSTKLEGGGKFKLTFFS